MLRGGQKVEINFSRDSIKKHFELPLFKNAYHLIFGTGIYSALGFLFWIIATRFYDPATIGITSAILSVLNLFAIIAELGLGIALIRFLPDAGQEEKSLINTCLTVSSLFSVLLAVVFILGLPLWGPAFIPLFISPVFALLFVGFSIIFTLLPILWNIFLAKRVPKFSVYINTLSGVMKLALLFVIMFISKSVLGLFFLSGLSAFIGLFIGIYIFLPKVTPSFRLFPMIDAGLLQKIRNYATINYISRLLLQMTPLILPSMIVNTLGSEMNAYFAVSMTIVAIVTVIPSSLFNSLLAESTHEETFNKINMKRALSLMLALLVPVTIVFLVLPDVILSLFGTVYSEHATPLLRILILSVIPWGIIYLFIVVERFKKSSDRLIYVTLAYAGLSLGLSYLMMVKWGLIGVGIGYLSAQIIVALVVMLFLWRMVHQDQSQNLLLR